MLEEHLYAAVTSLLQNSLSQNWEGDGGELLFEYKSKDSSYSGCLTCMVNPIQVEAELRGALYTLVADKLHMFCIGSTLSRITIRIESSEHRVNCVDQVVGTLFVRMAVLHFKPNVLVVHSKFENNSSQPWAALPPYDLKFLAAGSTPSVQQLHKSLLLGFTHAPCTTLPSSPLSTFPRLPGLWRDERGTVPSSRAWRTWLAGWPRRTDMKRDSMDVGRVRKLSAVSCSKADIRGDLDIVGAVPRYDKEGVQCNGTFSPWSEVLCSCLCLYEILYHSP